jgi:sulfite dehydrogenase (quinone) subunit SoeC
LHPALSVIVFTTASGAGYGLIALTGLWFVLGRLPLSSAFGMWTLGIGTALITGGLLASSLHLGRPERALRAFTQFGTSWLSREAVAAVATYLPLGVFAIGWGVYGRGDFAIALAAMLGAVGSIVTVYCTAMIYRSLKPVHQWANPHVVPVYLALAAMTGALILTALLQVWGRPDRLVAAVAVVATALAVLLKERYWRFIDGTPAPSTIGSATGLGRLGEVRLFEPPHTGSNYLMKEMGFRVARKHALKLRRLALVIGFALPLLLSLCAALIAGPLGALAAVLAAVSALVGVLVERWLFFAEAKHTVTLYYGAATA